MLRLFCPGEWALPYEWQVIISCLNVPSQWSGRQVRICEKSSNTAQWGGLLIQQWHPSTPTIPFPSYSCEGDSPPHWNVSAGLCCSALTKLSIQRLLSIQRHSSTVKHIPLTAPYRAPIQLQATHLTYYCSFYSSLSAGRENLSEESERERWQTTTPRVPFTREASSLINAWESAQMGWSSNKTIITFTCEMLSSSSAVPCMACCCAEAREGRGKRNGRHLGRCQGQCLTDDFQFLLSFKTSGDHGSSAFEAGSWSSVSRAWFGW